MSVSQTSPMVDPKPVMDGPTAMHVPALSAPDLGRDRLLDVLRAVSVPRTGEEYLTGLIGNLGTLFQADFVFVALPVSPGAKRVRVLAKWEPSAPTVHDWEIDIDGCPCQVVYEGKPTFIPCQMDELFAGKHGSGLKSYVGVPLHDAKGEVAGHLGIYSKKTLADDPAWCELAQLYGERASAELQRTLFEQERERMIADLWATNRQLDDLNQQKSELIRIVAHDLRSPLSVIQTAATMVLDGHVRGTAQVDSLELIRRGADRLLGLVDGYLNEHTIASGEQALSLAETDLAQLVEERVAVAQVLASAKDISMPAAIAIRPKLKLDEAKIVQVIDNLLGNAVKYCPPGATVSVDLARVGGHAELTVSDTGAGVPEAAREQIFDAFKMGGNETTGGESSYGLGLAICRDIVEAHGGSISHQEAAGGGALFKVRLPLT